MKKSESSQERSERILLTLSKMHPGKKAYDLDGRGLHFVCEIEPAADHPEYDRAVEVIISSTPHKHLKMTQRYTILKGSLELHTDQTMALLKEDDETVIKPGTVHWARSDGECWVEILSKPGWTPEDHIPVNLQ